MPRRIDEWQVEDYVRALRLHRSLIVFSVLIAVGLSWMVTANEPKVYQASARVLIEVQSPRFVKFEEVSAHQTLDRSFLLTEYQIIVSRAVLSRVVEKLHLSSFPPFARSKDPVRTLEGFVAVQPLRGTKLVDVLASARKPELAVRIANAVADTYAQVNQERRMELTSGGIEWLREEVDKMEIKMRDAQLKLQEFRESHENIDFTEDRQNSTLQRLQSLNVSLNKTREQRIEAETKYREKHPQLQELLIKEKELKLALFDQEQKVLEMSRLSIQYNSLLREARTSEQIYNVLLTRLKELSVQEGMQGNNVQVVDHAQVPESPIGIRRNKKLGTAAAFGFLLGCLLAFARELMTKTVRTRQDFEQLLGIPFLGHIPILPTRARGNRKVIRSEANTGPAAEAFRTIRTTLEFLLPSDAPQVLLITSALPEEGKTTVSTYLAYSLLELGRDVLMVDADMRRPILHRVFGLPLEPGLSDFLQQKVSAEEIVRQTGSSEGLSIVTAGATPHQPTDLLSQPMFRDLLNSWRQSYRYILVDSPPVLVAADAAVLGTLVDGVLYIVRAGRTHSEANAAGKQRLVDVGAKVVGGVLNSARLELERGYRYYYYHYYRYRRSQPRVSSSSTRRIEPSPKKRAPGQETEAL